MTRKCIAIAALNINKVVYKFMEKHNEFQLVSSFFLLLLNFSCSSYSITRVLNCALV